MERSDTAVTRCAVADGDVRLLRQIHDLGREFPDSNAAVIGEKSGAFETVAKLANIARPGICAKRLDHRRSELGRIHTADLCKNMTRQWNHILTALPQWWNVDFETVDAVHQIGAKRSFADGLFRIAVRRGK